jgi:hypothetical protein
MLKVDGEFGLTSGANIYELLLIFEGKIRKMKE